MGSKEEKHIVMEFQKKILQEAGCSAEVIAFLDEIEDEVFCEYYCFCFLDGMPIEEVRRIDSVPVQNWKDKIKRIREERTGYLERLFVPDAQVTQQISKLHEKAGRVFKETEELRDTINTTLKQTLKIQEEALVQQKESYQSTLASKAELLKDREDKIQSLLSEIEQNKAVWENEKKDLLFIYIRYILQPVSNNLSTVSTHLITGNVDILISAHVNPVKPFFLEMAFRSLNGNKCPFTVRFYQA